MPKIVAPSVLARVGTDASVLASAGSMNQRNALFVAGIIPWFILFGVKYYNKSKIAELIQESTQRIVEVIPIQEQITVMIKNQIVVQKEKFAPAAPETMTFTLSPVATGAGVLVLVGGFGYLFYFRNQDKKIPKIS